MSICCGCLLSPAFKYPLPEGGHIYRPHPTFCNEPGPELTDKEKEILHHLKEAWTKFMDLGKHTTHDIQEFNYAIHIAQQKMAVRVARRVDPEVWSQPNET